MFRLCVILLVAFAADSWVKGEDISTEFACDFEEDNCGFVSQKGLSAQWVRQKLEIGGRTGYVMTMVPEGDKSQTGRLISPYFEVEDNHKGCMQYDLHMDGDGAVAFHVEEQNDSGFQTVHSVSTTTKGWRRYKVVADIQSFIQFIFEGHVRPASGSSVIAIDNFSFRLTECPED